MPRDRTPEFRATLSSIRSRSAKYQSTSHPSGYSLSSTHTNESKQRLLPSSGPSAGGSGVDGKGKGKGRDVNGAGGQGGGKTEFTRMAGQISRDLASTTGKLGKLAQLAKRKTLFDDRPVEISELTYIIRQDISSLNTQIAQLQSYITQQAKVNAEKSGRSAGQGKGAVEEHNSNVVMMLQSRLAGVGVGFKDVLELRTQNMKASKDRTEQFMHTAQSGAMAPNQNSVLFNPAASSHPQSGTSSPVPGLTLPAHSTLLQPIDRKGKSRALPGQSTASSSTSDFLALDMSAAEAGQQQSRQAQGGPGTGYQQLQMMEQQDEYIQNRSTAIESIESTIAELGQIFQQLAGMVAQQGETVQRIDADVTDISANVTGAQRELLKYYASITSNRWLMLKIFGMLIIFFLLFILVS